MLRETDGTGEISELLASTLLIVVAISIFMASLASTIVLQAERLEASSMDNKAREFCILVRSSPELSSSPGTISPYTISNTETIIEAFPPGEVGFDYAIILEDTSLYDSKMKTIRLKTSPMPLEARSSSSLPVLLETGGREMRTGMLTVIIWKM